MKHLSSYTLFLLVLLGGAATLPQRASLGGDSLASSQFRTHAQVSPPADKNTDKAASLRIGIISYWEPSSAAWDRVPANSMVLINPHDGILEPNSNQAVHNSSEWVALFSRLKKKNMVVLGYVPTGYFDHVSCKKMPQEKCQTEERIRLQVKTYYQLIPSLDGIFYDETSPKDGVTPNYDKEYALLRSLNSPGHITVFNVGWPSAEAVKAAKAEEHLVLYESSPYNYHENAKLIAAMTREARDKGIIVWHLLHTVCGMEDMCSYVAKMAERGANYGYVTNIGGHWEAGENTWGSLPTYWEDELAAFSGQPCPKK